MHAAGPKTLTEVFDLTFISLLAGSSSAHTYANRNMHYSKFVFLAACLNKPPHHGNTFFTQRPLIGSQFTNVAAPTSFYIPFLKLMCMYVSVI